MNCVIVHEPVSLARDTAVPVAARYHPDPVVARLQAAVEEAFRRRRSLLLLNYETQASRRAWGT